MRFGALRARWYKGYLAGGGLVMAGDTAEHAITYWVMWQAFQSPLLAGFAVVSHWLPHLLFSVFFGSLADRFDCRRLIQVAIALFVGVSVAWGVLFATGVLQPWHCIVLLTLHGIAGVIWQPADGVLIFDIVGEQHVASGVRLMATVMSLGQLLGPAAGVVLLFTVGPAIGMFLNVLLYVPFAVYLFVMPIDGHRRRREAPPRVRLRAVVEVLRDLPKYPSILVVVVLQGAVALLIGTAVMPLLPDFGMLLGQDTSGLGYGMLVIAMSAGAVVGGLTLEIVGRVPANTRFAIASVLVFALSIGVFALSREFAVSLAALFVAGVSTIAAGSISQTIVQLESPPDQRGRLLGAYGMTSMGLRIGSGVLIGLLALAFGAPAATAIDAAVLTAVAIVLLGFVVSRRRDATRITEPEAELPPM